jgi:hypothetical protein
LIGYHGLFRRDVRDVTDENLCFMPIFVTSPVRNSIRHGTISGLVLQPVQGTKGTFKRFGTFDFKNMLEGQQAWFEEGLDDFDQNADKSGLEYTIGADNKKKFNVVVI